MNSKDAPDGQAPDGQALAGTALAGTARERAALVVLHEQRLRTGVVRVPTERVVLRRRIVTIVRQVEVSVRREELEVDRVPLNDQHPEAVAAPARPLVIVLSEEAPVVQVTTRPYEQVTVHLDTLTGSRQVTETLASERVEVLTDVTDVSPEPGRAIT